VFGAGLLEAVPERVIVEHADPKDADGDGVSGRANRVGGERSGGTRLGRFGWKANVPTVEQQTPARCRATSASRTRSSTSSIARAARTRAGPRRAAGARRSTSTRSSA